MKKPFKKVYIEITNCCNLYCSFCSPSQKRKKMMSIEEFEHILKEVQPYTDYVYLHIKGEPLLHPKLDALLSLCEQYHLKVNITTNGTLVDQVLPVIQKHQAIHQINFSLHCEQTRTDYPDIIFTSVSHLSPQPLIIYRLWAQKRRQLDKKSTTIVEKLKNYYHLSPEVVEKIKTDTHVPIAKNIFVDKQPEFDWPAVENDYFQESGFCYGLKSHFGILVDGTVVPCCLDGEGIINLGNIFTDSLTNILNTTRAKNLRMSFTHRHAVEPLCCHCSYKARFNKEEKQKEHSA